MTILKIANFNLKMPCVKKNSKTEQHSIGGKCAKLIKVVLVGFFQKLGIGIRLVCQLFALFFLAHLNSTSRKEPY